MKSSTLWALSSNVYKSCVCVCVCLLLEMGLKFCPGWTLTFYVAKDDLVPKLQASTGMFLIKIISQVFTVFIKQNQTIKKPQEVSLVAYACNLSTWES